MKEIPQTLDELIDKKLGETESTTRKQYGPSREEKLAEITRQRLKKEQEDRERKSKRQEEEIRRRQERIEREKETLISRIEKYPDIFSIRSFSSYIDGTPIINVVITGDYVGEEDIAKDLEFCHLIFEQSARHDIVDNNYKADCGTGINGGYVRLDGIGAKEVFRSGEGKINSLGRKMKRGLIELLKNSNSYVNSVNHIGESMDGGKILTHGLISCWTIGMLMRGGEIQINDTTFCDYSMGENMSGGEIKINHRIGGESPSTYPWSKSEGSSIGKNMSRGMIYIKGDVSNCSLGENMSGGEIVIEGRYNSDRKTDERSEDINIHIGRSMSGGRIIIKGQVYKYWKGKEFIPLPTERIGGRMTGGTITLEKYCYRGSTSLYRRPKFLKDPNSVNSLLELFSNYIPGGWFMPNIYAKRLVLEK